MTSTLKWCTCRTTVLKNCSDGSRYSRRLLMMEMTSATSQSFKTCSVHQLPSLGVLKTFCRRYNAVVTVIQVGTFNGQCNRFQVTFERISCSLSRIGDSSFCFCFENKFHFKNRCMCILASSSLDSHKRRTCPVGSILAWTDRS